MNILKIRNIMRVAIASSALVFSLSGGAAFAQISVAGSNNTTGPSSDNQNAWDVFNRADVTVNNGAEANNNNDISVQTGETSVANNTQVASITTGGVIGSISVNNDLNSGSVTLPSTNGGNATVNFNNTITGPSSDNQNVANITSTMAASIHNDANINNNLDLHANTGRNDIQSDTTVGDVKTGSISFTAASTNKANTGASSVDLSGMQPQSVSSTFTNGTTGPNSENKNTVNVTNTTAMDLHNDANINNNTAVCANTGENKINNNTVVGNVSTGDVNITLTSTNTAN